MSGQQFLFNESNSILAVSSFFDAVSEGCSKGLVALKGGYDSINERLALDIEINVGSTTSALDVVNTLEDLFRKDCHCRSDHIALWI